jgi:1,4-dihydroxy-2-naphthoyl-CoA hydrolase
MDGPTLLRYLNKQTTGFNSLLGLVFTKISKEEVVAELEVKPCHLQPLGLVHGGVYCTMVETIGSTGAALHVMDDGKMVSGMDNHTSFLKAVRAGILVGKTRPIHIGNRTQLWQAEIFNDLQQLVASGTLRLMVSEGQGQPPNIH